MKTRSASPAPGEIGEKLLSALMDCEGPNLRPMAEGAGPEHAATAAPGRGWGYKTQWFTFQTNDVRRVLEILGLKNPQEVGWNEGLDPPGDQVFVTPPIYGWVLAQCGFEAVPSIGAVGDGNYRLPLTLLEGASAHVGGQVHYLGTHRTADYHAWALAQDGRIARAFSYDGGRGEVGLAEGEVTAAERALGMIPLPDPDPSDRYGCLLDAEIEVDEEWPHKLAASWGIDPLSFGVSRDAPPAGWRARGPGTGCEHAVSGT